MRSLARLLLPLAIGTAASRRLPPLTLSASDGDVPTFTPPTCVPSSGPNGPGCVRPVGVLRQAPPAPTTLTNVLSPPTCRTADAVVGPGCLRLPMSNRSRPQPSVDGATHFDLRSCEPGSVDAEIGGLCETVFGVGQSQWVDFDGDGDLDLFVVVGSASGTTMYVNTLSTQRPRPHPATPHGPLSVPPSAHERHHLPAAPTHPLPRPCPTDAPFSGRSYLSGAFSPTLSRVSLRRVLSDALSCLSPARSLSAQTRLTTASPSPRSSRAPTRPSDLYCASMARSTVCRTASRLPTSTTTATSTATSQNPPRCHTGAPAARPPPPTPSYALPYAWPCALPQLSSA